MILFFCMAVVIVIAAVLPIVAYRREDDRARRAWIKDLDAWRGPPPPCPPEVEFEISPGALRRLTGREEP